MTAIKTTNIVEGNLATEPKYFPKGQYVARIVFRIMHTDRDGTPQATSVINGTRIIPNQLVNQRRANRQQSNSTSLPQYANAVPEQDPWAGQQAQA